MTLIRSFLLTEAPTKPDDEEEKAKKKPADKPSPDDSKKETPPKETPPPDAKAEAPPEEAPSDDAPTDDGADEVPDEDTPTDDLEDDGTTDETDNVDKEAEDKEAEDLKKAKRKLFEQFQELHDMNESLHQSISNNTPVLKKEGNSEYIKKITAIISQNLDDLNFIMLKTWKKLDYKVLINLYTKFKTKTDILLEILDTTEVKPK